MERFEKMMKQIGIIALSFALAISFMPVFGQTAFAGENETDPNDVTEVTVNADIFDEDVIFDGVETPATPLDLVKGGNEPYGDAIDAAECEEPAVQNGGKHLSALGAPPMSQMYVEESPYATLDVALDKKTGKAVITGAVNEEYEYTFDELYVDDIYISGAYGEKEFTVEVNMKDMEVGYHDVYAYLDTGAMVVYPYAVPTYIYKKPSNTKRHYYAESKFFVYYASDVGSYYYDPDCSIYLQYKKGSVAWSKCKKYKISPYSNLQMNKCKPAAKYKIRTFYGKSVSYNGKTYFFSGLDRGYISSVVTIKMGTKKKPPVKSIKPVKVKHKKWTINFVDSWGNLVGSQKVWRTTYKLKITMKKKPKAKGIDACVGDYSVYHRIKGNKKKYTSGEFYSTDTKKYPKRKIIIYSWQDKAYGGFSPDYKKTIKLK